MNFIKCIVNLMPLFVALLCMPCNCQSICDGAKFMFFYGPSASEYQVYGCADMCNITNHTQYNSSRTTAFYIHGYLESNASNTVQSIINAYLKRNDSNLIVIDWWKLADGDFLMKAIPNAHSLGIALGQEFFAAIEKKRCLILDLIHIIGHSLGAYVAATIARESKSKSNETLIFPRISGLDPSGLPLLQLNKDDAVFVDMIHVDIGFYGCSFCFGHVDFYPNWGHRIQPPCPIGFFRIFTPDDLCSHQHSVGLWAESVASEKGKAFPAVRLKDCILSKANLVNISDITEVTMGVDCKQDARGDYILRTNKTSPYSLGTKGVCYFN